MIEVKGWEITKEIFDEAIANGGAIPAKRYLEVFNASLVMGYGIYETSVREADGKYFVDFLRGNTCD